MAKDNSITAKDYPVFRIPLVMNSAGFILIPAYETETLNLKRVPTNIDIMVPTSVQEYPIGSLLWRGFERWVYIKAGEGLTIGGPVQSAPAVHADQQEDIAVAAAAAIGDTEIWLTSTSDLDGSPNETDNNFAGGFVHVNDEAGEGQIIMIKANAAFGTTEDSLFKLYDKLTIALTTASECGLIKNPAYDVLKSKAVLTGKLMGVASVAFADNYFGWLKYRGPCSVDMHAAVALGTKVVVGTTAVKADPASCDTTEINLGEAMTPGITDGEKAIVWLNIGV